MKNKTKLINILTVAGIAAVTAVCLTFAAPPASSTQGKAGDAQHTIQERLLADVYPGLQPGPTGKNADGDLKKAVKRALEKQEDVSVKVDDGVVTLSGQVATQGDRERAIAAARNVKGVRIVQDQIQVAGAGSQTVGEYIDDAGITTAVKGKLLAEEGLSSFKISVDTIDGVVTLTGDVKTQAQVDKAGALARQTDGVKRVDNKLLIKP